MARSYGYGPAQGGSDFPLIVRGIAQGGDELQLTIPPSAAGVVAGWVIGRLASTDARLDVETLQRAARRMGGEAKMIPISQRAKIQAE